MAHRSSHRLPPRPVEVTHSGDQVSISNAAFNLSYDLKSGTWSATDLAAQTTVFAKARFTLDEIGWKIPAGGRTITIIPKQNRFEEMDLRHTVCSAIPISAD